jgi:hypothetical protein
MLRAMRLATQWRQILEALPAGWAGVRLALRVADQQSLDRAAALLGPLNPGLAGMEIRFFAAHRGSGPSPAAVGRALARLDEERISAELRVVGVVESGAAAAAARPSAVDAWDALLETLPADWSDLYCEVELTSSDHLEPAALALAPLNPARVDGAVGFRFRCARRFGYGAAPEMVSRCLERLDERSLPAEVRILVALSDTKPVGTQGPVWYIGGRAV